MDGPDVMDESAVMDDHSDPLIDLLIDLHIDGDRQGPGSRQATRLAISLSRLEGATDLAIADIGCGTGASTLVLADVLDARITAVDLSPRFLARLDAAAAARGLADRIATLAGSMDALAFEDGSLDAIWSEGAIYNIGFEHGARAWRRYLKPGGVLAVSEITWLTHQRPPQIEDHWAREYPEVATASAKLGVLEAAGYSPLGYFALPETCWLDEYYRPLQSRFDAFLDRHAHSVAAQAMVEAERREISLYERFADAVGYGFYVAARTTR